MEFIYSIYIIISIEKELLSLPKSNTHATNGETAMNLHVSMSLLYIFHFNLTCVGNPKPNLNCNEYPMNCIYIIYIKVPNMRWKPKAKLELQ